LKKLFLEMIFETVLIGGFFSCFVGCILSFAFALDKIFQMIYNGIITKPVISAPQTRDRRRSHFLQRRI